MDISSLCVRFSPYLFIQYTTIDTSVNCASADVFVKVVKSTLDKRYKREMFLRNKKDLAGVVVPNVRDIRSMDVYICTNEDRYVGQIEIILIE